MYDGYVMYVWNSLSFVLIPPYFPFIDAGLSDTDGGKA